MEGVLLRPLREQGHLHGQQRPRLPLRCRPALRPRHASLHAPKWLPISLSVPDPDTSEKAAAAADSTSWRSRPGLAQTTEKGSSSPSIVYAKPDELCFDKVWHRHSLPLPPFVLEPGFDDETTRIRSHAVFGGGSHLCVSFSRGAGTHCFDTASGEWSRAGDWTLLILGKAEYVPELNLWFGLNEHDLPCVSDLSGALTGHKPELCGVWRRYHPPDWS